MRIEVPYVYARSLEFEGRHPHDVGQWGITNMRLCYMEGLPDLLTECMVPLNDDGTIQNTLSWQHRIFWSKRIRFYRRIRSAEEAAQLLSRRGPNGHSAVCLPLYASWLAPENGLISMPNESEQEAPETHAVKLIAGYRLGSVGNGVPDAPHFLFQNSWGEGWGHKGRGMLPFAYYNRYGFEHWTIYYIENFKQTQIKKQKPDCIAWQGREEFDRRVYAFEIGDPNRERLGWAFAVETDDALEVEELFVAPEARRRGIGGRLAELMVELAVAKRLPLRVWVPFADSARESPATAPALPAMARRLGVQFHPSPVRWAAYYATSEQIGTAEPIEPIYFPGRPKSTLAALSAFVASAAMTVGTSATPSTITPVLPAPMVLPADLSLDSPEWKLMNRRRAELIRKKNRAGLDTTEQMEFDQLQATARALVGASSPRPILFAPEVDAIIATKAL